MLRYRELSPTTEEKDIVAVIEYNLDRDVPRRRVDGLIAFLTDRLEQYEDNKLVQTLSLDEVERLALTVGVGCVFVEYEDKRDHLPHLLCRAAGHRGLHCPGYRTSWPERQQDAAHCCGSRLLLFCWRRLLLRLLRLRHHSPPLHPHHG